MTVLNDIHGVKNEKCCRLEVNFEIIRIMKWTDRVKRNLQPGYIVGGYFSN